MRVAFMAMGLGFLVATVCACAAGNRPFAEPWIDGTDAAEPEAQTQRYDRDTYVIRQSLRTHPEGPFLYLLFGEDRALLLDTGAGGLEIRPVVETAIDQWLAERDRSSIPLVVAHSHSHDDHWMGDSEFQARPDTTVVGLKPADVAAFFGISKWPHTTATFDLGGRVLQIIPTPGHHPSHIMIFDERTRLLLSGDTLYPGRLYVPGNTVVDFRESIDRVVAFTDELDVRHILGTHIEMTREPGKDFALGAASHPNEHVLELPYSTLLELQSALHGMGDTATRVENDEFIIFPLPPRPVRAEDLVPE